MKTKLKVGASILCLLLTLSGCGAKGEELLPPELYSIGDSSAPPLDSLLTEGGSLVSFEALTADGTPVTASPEASADPENPDAAVPKAEQLIYTYAELPAAHTDIKAYMELLTGEDYGFLVVDDKNMPVEPPDYTAATGTVLLAKDAVDEKGKIFRIRVDWTETSCAITVDQPEGSLTPEVPETMTVTEAIAYVYSLPPSALGLAGASMDAYNIYSIEGIVKVDEKACMQFRVYQRTEAGTNAVMGSYLISGDKSQLYRLDKAAGTVEVLS